MSKYGYGKRRAFKFRLPNAKVPLLRVNLDRGLERLLATMCDADLKGIRENPLLKFFWAYHDAIVATYGWHLLHHSAPDETIKENYIKANSKLHDLLGEEIGETNDNPFTDDTLW